ncbi:hypothetical protein VCR20J5_880009 [Vibrio crassostreae]|uniref:Uncharacterized protein n=1 Tax=Vibrio crassostreae TaxID=246167 RepID=A0A822N825_9VIBR|nr:hypothetical protein VCR5J5_890010 [Vibrio crassostreae]CDT72886.1 hypothetical protein VCR20J5_880009 [Vibrio crassostreae]
MSYSSLFVDVHLLQEITNAFKGYLHIAIYAIYYLLSWQC